MHNNNRRNEINQRIILIGVILLTTWFVSHDAYAISLGWIPGNFTTPNGFAIWSGGPLPQNPPLFPNQFEVTDENYTNNGISDKIDVLLNSTSDPTGITLTLDETGDTGHFYNTNFIFANGTGLHDISSTQTVGISGYGLNTDPNVIEHVISGPDNPNSGIWVVSSSDFNGIYLNLTETGPNTGIFTSPLKFTTGPSVNGSAIHANPKDIVSIVDVWSINNGGFNYDDTTVEIVTPNSDKALDALPAKWNDVINVVYKGVKLTGSITNTADPGGGGGGLIQPGLVLDILAALGGSPSIVSPPSFGGAYYHYSDGLTITQDNNKTIFDTSKYNQEIPKQVMVTGQRVNMTFKTFENYNPTAVIHMGLYIIPRGDDMLTTNSIASIAYDKNLPVEVNDPNHILSNSSASSTTDGKFQYTQFSFVPTKSYDKMSFLARAWNDHLYSTDIRVHDEVIKPPMPTTLPVGVILYDNYYDLQAALEKDHFYKSQIMAHIHSTTDVFESPDGGHIYWLYDTIKHSVTLVIVDKDNNNLISYTMLLEPYPSEKKGDYGFMKFTTTQLNRWDEKQEEQFKDIEATKAMFSALEKGLIVPSNWQPK